MAKYVILTKQQLGGMTFSQTINAKINANKEKLARQATFTVLI